jgi:transposase
MANSDNLWPMSRHAEAIELSDEDRATLEGWVRAHSSSQQVVKRARVILMAAQGASNRMIAEAVGLSRPRVIEWRRRFTQEGPRALTRTRPGRGRKSPISAEKVREIVDATTQTKPRAATHWSCRTMAEAQGVSHSTIQRIWDAHGLQPHRVRTFKLSKDAHFVDKLVDVVGLYLNPPDKAVVLCVDEKSQIQALDRTQPGLPLKKGRCGTMTHDYKRNGTTTLFAALDVLEGRVIGQCHDRHRHQEFLKFLRVLDREFPKSKGLHLVVDNYSTHKHPKVKVWLVKHPRFHLHFTPTSASWLNLVERWFREITEKRIRRGVFRSVSDLVAAIEDYLACHNEDPKPFVWTASVEKIIEKVTRCKSIFGTLH